MRRYLLIGAGVAGISAAEAIRSQDPSGDILQVGDEPHGFYSRPGLAFYLTGELSEKQLFLYSEADYRRIGVRRLNARVNCILPEQHEVEMQNGTRLCYDRLLIATGASAACLQAPGAELQGVVKLDNLDDARHILKLARRARTAVVVGGGITALELVEGLAAHKVKVHYFLRGDRYWSNVLDETESRIVEARLQAEGVQIHFQTEIQEILGRKGVLAAVRKTGGQLLTCDILAVAIGTLPRLALAQAAGLKIERGILTDEYLQTSDPDIYAAGDVAQVYDPLAGRSVLDSLWTPARDQGWAAGQNMAGCHQPYRKIVPFNVTRLANLTTTIIGTVGNGRGDNRESDLLAIARGDSETWRQLPDAIAAQSDFEVNRLRVLVGERRILGSLVIGDQTLSRPLQRLIMEEADISHVRDTWLQPRVPLADLIADFYYHWQDCYAA
jgi:NAD(P)H-nitrite reductase large subunit